MSEANLWVEYRADSRGADTVTMICRGTLPDKAIAWLRRRHGERFRPDKATLPPVDTRIARLVDVGETLEGPTMTIAAVDFGPLLQAELERFSERARIYGAYDDGIGDFLEYDLLFGPDN